MFTCLEGLNFIHTLILQINRNYLLKIYNRLQIIIITSEFLKPCNILQFTCVKKKYLKL